MIRVVAAVPAEVAFDYLSDPRNRPQWQSSLRGVEIVDDGPVHVGQRWRDVTRVPGIRPRMRTSVLDRPLRWTEEGAWRGFAVEAVLDFVPTEGGCRIAMQVRWSGRGWQRPAGAVLGLLGRPAIAADLRRAVRLMESRAT